MQETSPLLTIPEAAKRLGITDKTLRNWARADYAKTLVVGPTNRLRITEAEVERLAALMQPRPVAS